MNKYEKSFEGYAVPENIKEIVTKIMIRFSIDGLCDGMYIANVMAVTANIGDGCGSFTGNVIAEPIKVAERLQVSYGCNIFKNDIEELTTIISENKINPEVAIPKMKAFIKKIKNEKKTCDTWRIDFLNREIELTNENIKLLEA